MEKTLLLVDDEENVIRSLRRLFRQEPFTVLSANSGQEGLAILEQQHVSVILSDQRMPGMIGSEFLKIVTERFPDTIRIVMSGYTELESITSAINDGAIFKFLLKPWDDEKLLGHIRDAFSYQDLKSHNVRLAEELQKVNAGLEDRIKEEREKNKLSNRSLLMSQELLDRMPVAVFGISNEGLIVMANQYARALVNRDAVVGNMVDDIMPESIANILLATLMHNESDTVPEIKWPGQEKVVKIIPIRSVNANCICVSVA